MALKQHDRRTAYYDRALGRSPTIPKYDTQCQLCRQESVHAFTYAEYDQHVKGFIAHCPVCATETAHRFQLKSIPGVEWRTDGATKVDWADPHTKYQREHFQESGDRSERRRRRDR